MGVESDQTIKIMVGVAGSGKSTIAKAWVAEDPDNRVRVNRDSFRKMITGSSKKAVLSQEMETIVTKAQTQVVEESIKAGKSVVIDDTNLRARIIRTWMDLALKYGIEWDVHVVNVDVETALKQNSLRGADKVPDEVIEKMHRNFFQKGKFKVPEPTPVDKSVDNWKTYVPDESLPQAFLVDIDGTVALMGNKRGPFDYHLANGDDLNEPVSSVVHALIRDGYEIIFLSGRSDSCRDVTQEWLIENHFGGHKLLMRREGDQRKDSIVKHEIFWDQIAPRFQVIGCFDDRNQVVDMYREMGITVFQVAPGDF